MLPTKLNGLVEFGPVSVLLKAVIPLIGQLMLGKFPLGDSFNYVLNMVEIKKDVFKAKEKVWVRPDSAAAINYIHTYYHEFHWISFNRNR